MTIMPAPCSPQRLRDIPNQPGSGSSSTVPDPAASLREAALLTLKKSRQRKLGSGSEPAGLPPRPAAPVEPSIQLDYGQEEPSGASSTASSAPGVAPAAKLATPEPQEDEGQGREEGEISDSESLPATPISRIKVLPEPTTKPAAREVVKSTPPPKLSPIKTSMAPSQAPPEESTSSAVSTRSASQQMLHPPLPLPYLLDENHVRPGLDMTQGQYDTAKDIVLDLLGWGVPPEYLVTCGISHEIVYYVFTELNLCLPVNFDSTGIPPYPPVPVDLKGTPITNMAKSFDSMALHPTNVTTVALNSRTPSSRSSPPTTASVVLAGASSSSRAPAPPNLFDMEQQRRQELLARKAAMALRKPKQQAEPPPGSTTTLPVLATREPQDVEMAGAVPSNTVDDFLKSIDAVSDKDSGKEKSPTPHVSAVSSVATTDSMDVDEPIPGLSIGTTIASPAPTLPPATVQSTSTAAALVSATRSQSATDVLSSTGRSPQSIASSSGERSPVSRSNSDTDTIPGLSLASTSETNLVASSRRGTKRPVAADFDDDLQLGSSRTRTNSDGYHTNPYHQSFSRRKVGSFAGLGGMRRCVIDVSDSEEEEDEEGAIPDEMRPSDGASPTQGASVARRAPQSKAPGSARQTPPVSVAPDSGTPTGVLTPAALQEKEEEIRKMRELIAQREQSRLRKIAAMSRSTPPMTTELPATNGTTYVSVQYEDGDTSASGSRTSRTPVSLGALSIPSSASITTSTVATPIDVVANSLVHPLTGDRVVTAEARQEQLVLSSGWMSSEDVMNVDVPGSTAETSAQVEACSSEKDSEAIARNEDARSGYAAYSSPLDCFPMLRAHSRLGLGLGGSSGALYQQDDGLDTCSISSSPRNTSIDLKDLKVAHGRNMLTDPSRQICQYEVPGGGECRDRECESIHLSRPPTVDPTDDETAHYVYAHFVVSAGSSHSVNDIKGVLEKIRRRCPTKSFDDRVSEAVASLGLV